MNYGIFGGATRWGKVLIKNFNKKKCKLIFTSSKFIKNNNKNILDIRKIPKNVDFIIIATNPYKNFKLLNLFLDKNIFCEKPILPNYKNFKNIKIRKKLIFCNYQHIYSNPINFFKRQLSNKKNYSIEIRFGKNGKERKVPVSYEWLTHPLSIIFYLGVNLNNVIIKNVNYKSKYKQNFSIQNKNINILSGNNFKKKEYSIRMQIKDKTYFYNAVKPLHCYINNKKFFFSQSPLQSSIIKFLSFLRKPKIYKKEIALNMLITKKIMLFLEKNKI
jgi:hypothetical protein